MTGRQLEQARWLEPIEDFVVKHGRTPDRWAVLCTYQLTVALDTRYNNLNGRRHAFPLSSQLPVW